MVDTRIDFKCKICEKEQYEYIHASILYKINNNKCDYIDVICNDCSTLHFIASGAVTISEDTEEAKEDAFKRVEHIIGNSKKAKEWYYERTIFITEDLAILIEKDITTIENGGVILY